MVRFYSEPRILTVVTVVRSPLILIGPSDIEPLSEEILRMSQTSTEYSSSGGSTECDGDIVGRRLHMGPAVICIGQPWSTRWLRRLSKNKQERDMALQSRKMARSREGSHEGLSSELAYLWMYYTYLGSIPCWANCSADTDERGTQLGSLPT